MWFKWSLDSVQKEPSKSKADTVSDVNVFQKKTHIEKENLHYHPHTMSPSHTQFSFNYMRNVYIFSDYYAIKNS